MDLLKKKLIMRHKYGEERENKMEKTMVAVLERDGEVNGRQEDALHNLTLQEENRPQYSPV